MPKLIIPPAAATGTIIITIKGNKKDFIKIVNNIKMTNKAIKTFCFILNQVLSSSLAAPDNSIEMSFDKPFLIGFIKSFSKVEIASSNDIFS